MMKILLLGSNGQLGFDIQRFHQKLNSHFEIIPFTRKNLDVSLVENVLPSLSDLQFDILINCTSYHKTDEVEKNATLAFAINAHAVKAMAEACEKKKAKFIHISTDYVFSGKQNSSSLIPYKETDLIGPLNVYGASKAMGEQLALFYNSNTFILRVASLFGVAGASGKGGNFVETMIKFGKEKGVLKVVNDITMSPTSTAQIAQMIFKLLEREVEPGIYHAVNSGQATWFEFAKEIIKETKISADVIPVTSQEFPTVALRPPYSVLDNGKIQKIIGEIPHWRESLNKYLQEKGYLS